MKGKKKINVLQILANPVSTVRLRLDAEAREISQSLERGKYRNDIHITTKQAATIKDVQRALLEESFQIIHISGHGTQNGLILSNEQGGQCLVHMQTLAELLSYFSIECVLLNACYSTQQGRLFSSISYTIAMEGPITDNVAIAFSSGFYDALAAGHPYDFAYKMGISRVKFEVSPAAQLPTLIKNGEVISSPQIQANEDLGTSERTYVKKGKYLVGFALDLSGSMDQSIHNRTDVDISRLKSLDQSFNDLMKNAQESMRESQARGIETSLDLFVYGFGLRSLAVCDLLSLFKAGRELFTRDKIDAYVEQYKKEKQTILQPYTEVAKALALGELWSFGEEFVQRIGKDTVRKRILRDIKPLVEARTIEIGDTTLAFEELAQLWESSEITLSNVREFILGDTPMKEVLKEVLERFQRELSKRDPKTQSVFFLVSDGKFTDANPLPIAKKLQAMGVTIVSCFISNQDIANPRELRDRADPLWGAEAELMFKMASPMGDLPETRRFLLNHNWTIYPHPKLFVQLNHSDVLREFVRVSLSMLEESEAAQSLPRGW